MPTARYGTAVQLDLPFSDGGSLHATIQAYLSRQVDGLADATISDYQERAKWLLAELGPDTPIAAITFDVLERLANRWRGVLRNVTVKRRIVFLRAAMRLAVSRGYLDKVPAIPRLRDDGQPRAQLHTVGQWEVFRTYLPPGPHRRFYDLGFWTGMHTSDLFTMRRCDLDPDRPVVDDFGAEVARGMYLRRNSKNRRSEPTWIPLQPEAIMAAREILAETPPLEGALLVGTIWNLRRHFHAAASRCQVDGTETGDEFLRDMPAVSPIDLRRSYASMLSARHWPLELIRIALGHEGQDSRTQGGRTSKPTIALRHYMRPTPALIVQGAIRPGRSE